ncbi:MAG: hypothetical protein IJ111_03825 [Eggerthellaceae bacterium]|nr:hypothetical protein [Eggerthellaceae bacterium]
MAEAMKAYRTVAPDGVGESLYEPLAKRVPDWGAQMDGADFEENVTLRLSVPAELAGDLVSSVREFSNARAVCTLGSCELRYLP